MNNSPSTNRWESYLRIFLRLTGAACLLALIAVVMPYRWMDAAHQAMGMGPMPKEPVVGYLARSTSAFYAMYGGLLWLASTDLRKYHAVLNYLGFATLFLGTTLCVVDWVEGLPKFWALWEGPFDMVLGSVMLYLNHRVQAELQRA